MNIDDYNVLLREYENYYRQPVNWYSFPRLIKIRRKGMIEYTVKIIDWSAPSFKYLGKKRARMEYSDHVNTFHVDTYGIIEPYQTQEQAIEELDFYIRRRKYLRKMIKESGVVDSNKPKYKVIKWMKT